MSCVDIGKLLKSANMCCMISNFENKEGQIQLSSSGNIMRPKLKTSNCALINTTWGYLLSFDISYIFDIGAGVLRVWIHSITSLVASRAEPQCTEMPPLPWP